jgi:hypothetical protein
MARRRQICDVPGCEGSRLSWQRICDRCWRRLPGDIRTGITEAFRLRRYTDHRQHCRRAAEHIAAAECRSVASTPLEERPPQWWQRD